MRNYVLIKPFLFVLLVALPGNAQSGFAHPLDPLNPEEIAAVVLTLKTDNKATESSRFWPLVLNEPPKAEVLSFRPGQPFKREAFVVVFERAANKTFEAVVDVKSRKVISWKEIKGVQPSIMASTEDFLLTRSIVNSDLRWRAALQKRGIADYECYGSTWIPELTKTNRVEPGNSCCRRLLTSATTNTASIGSFIKTEHWRWRRC